MGKCAMIETIKKINSGRPKKPSKFNVYMKQVAKLFYSFQ